MIRPYDSNRRKKAAEQTRKDILQAALKLHWKGITGFGPLAIEAGCSLATLRKHFPSKELLFQNCTRVFAETLEMPDLSVLGGIAGHAQRLTESVSELCRIHEAMLGYAWLSAHRRQESPTLDAEMNAYEGLTNAIAGIITPTESAKAHFIRGLLDFLTYRAMRLSAQLSPEETREELIMTVQLLISEQGSLAVHSPARSIKNHEGQ